MKFESEPEPKIEEQEPAIEEIELEPEIKEAIEKIGKRAGDLVVAESGLEDNIPEDKRIELRKKGMLMKAARALTLVVAFTAVGGAANKVEAGDSWRTRQRQTTGDVFKDFGIRVGGSLLREKMERDYEKTRERIRELENELAALEEALDKKQTDLKNVKAQEVTGADVSGLVADIEAEMQRLIGKIDAGAKEMDKLRKSSIWQKMGTEAVRRATGGQGSWRTNR